MSASAPAVDSLEPLLSRLRDARAHTDGLFTFITPDAMYDRPISERHRLIFYLGHLEAFDWNLLGRGALALAPHHAEFDQLFSFGIDPTRGNLPCDVPSDWPSEAQILDYNRQCRDRLDDVLQQQDTPRGESSGFSAGTLLHVAIEHRLMHAETLAYLLHQLPYEKKRGPVSTSPAFALSRLGSPRAVTIPRGIATVGLPRRDGAESRFGWDNEFDETRVEVPEFSIDVFPVTNAQFLEFVRAGGYYARELWTPEDWEWKRSHELHQPLFWDRFGDAWFYRGMFQLIPLPDDWPVFVSHAEASAYARWIGKSLPTETQWHRTAYGTPQEEERAYPWGNAAPDATRGNFDAAHWDPESVTAHPAGASAFGVHDLLGNGWEWTSTPFSPLPGFEPFPFYRGYSADFFDGRHYVMKGGSPRTAACMLRRSFRNWFQPRYPYVYAKFRCVQERAT